MVDHVKRLLASVDSQHCIESHRTSQLEKTDGGQWDFGGIWKVESAVRFMHHHKGSSGNWRRPTILRRAQVGNCCHASAHTQTHMLICKDLIPLMMCRAATLRQTS